MWINRRWSACLFVFIAIFLRSPVGGADEPQTAWPQLNGPFGNFTPRQTGAELVDNMADAKQLWLSETTDLGYAKGSVSGYLRHLAEWQGHPGSCSAPILADGLIFVTSFRPTGQAWAEELPQYKNWDNATAKKPFTAEQLARLRDNLRILADDLTVAIDQKTGKTVWMAEEKGKGLNRYMGKRQGFCVSPAYHQGVVFSMGTTGLLYAYDAKTGAKRWETNIGEAHHNALAHKETTLAKKSLPGGMGWNTSLTIAGGRLIVPLFDGGQDLSLRAVDMKSGETLWEVAEVCSRHATPSTWTHNGKPYLLTATVSGELHLIDPHQGKALWTVKGLGENHFSLTPSDDYVFVNAGSDVPRKEGDTRRFGRLAGYKISPEKAELAWKLPERDELYFQTWMDSCARRFLAVSDGKVYYRSHGLEKNTQARLMQIDEKSGEILASVPFRSPAPLFYPVEGRLLMQQDASHREQELAFIDFDLQKEYQRDDFWQAPHVNTTAYEVALELPYVDGRLYLRTGDGRIACYDLRK